MTWLGEHWLDLLGWGGSALLVYSLLQSRVLRFRVLNLIACVVLVIFNALIGVWPMVGMNVVLSAINLWFIVTLLSERHDEASFEVLPVGPREAYLTHVLRTHHSDIVKFQPDFDEVCDDDISFVVQRGDETVGVVVLSTRGDEARIRLDYVTPKYRDLTPGEFVWRRSSLLTELGVRRVVSSPQMVGAYYSLVGFRPEGDTYVLELR